MRIASSQVEMGSNHNYSRMGVRSGNKGLSSSEFTGALSKSVSLMQDYDRSLNYNKKGNYADEGKIGEVENDTTARDESRAFTYDVINSLLKKLLNSGAFDLPDMTGTSGYMNTGLSYGFESQGSMFSGGGYTDRIVTYQESESMSFSAEGMAVTEDGRQIDFGISISMSRSFTQYMNVRIPAMQNALMDPLVVNLGAGTARVSDQKFSFDLDADGVEDRISMPTAGSAFLALDINEDGTINDGNELFGAKSGDGFGDLRAYDSDGNGWIDENDEIFEKLKVWYKDVNGKDVLMNLKEADVGAIFLGEQDSEFSLHDGGGNMSGMIRSSGIFLRESGGVGIIQHVDLALEGENTPEEAYYEPEYEEEEIVEPENKSAGVLTLDLESSDKETNVSKAASDRAKKRSELEAKRAARAEKKRQLEERLEKRRMERKELQEKFYEKNLERRKLFSVSLSK